MSPGSAFSAICVWGYAVAYVGIRGHVGFCEGFGGAQGPTGAAQSATLSLKDLLGVDALGSKLPYGC